MMTMGPLNISPSPGGACAHGAAPPKGLRGYKRGTHLSGPIRPPDTSHVQHAPQARTRYNLREFSHFLTKKKNWDLKKTTIIPQKGFWNICKF